MKLFRIFCILCVSVVNCFALNREAFTFAKYDLEVRIEPGQKRLAARGKITLRNDSSAPQKNISLQISSTLDWRSIQLAGKPVQFLSQEYVSDIDHTGALTEAIVILPQEVPPKSTIELEVGYEGTIPQNANRLTRIGVPAETARHSDWDQISDSFTALRGAGHVAWYPVAMESANLSDGNSLFETLGRWKARQANSEMKLRVSLLNDDEGQPTEIVSTATDCKVLSETSVHSGLKTVDCSYTNLGLVAPLILAADYAVLDQPASTVHYLSEHKAAAQNYAQAAEAAKPFIAEWFGDPRGKIVIAELPDKDAAPFESGNLLLTPLGPMDAKSAEMIVVHQLTHAALASPRPWIDEGLAHFAQAVYRERQRDRQSALDFMRLHNSAIVDAEKSLASQPNRNLADDSLINTSREEFYRSKAMYVWWMLHDMLGDEKLKKVIAAYRAGRDEDASTIQRLVAQETHRDMEWFFDDWVYRDRGLPDFRIESVYPRQMLQGGYMVTVTVENLGNAGAEVPVTVKFPDGDETKRLEVRAKTKSSIRIEVPTFPAEVVVNDGSVPESDTNNNVFKVEAQPK